MHFGTLELHFEVGHTRISFELLLSYGKTFNDNINDFGVNYLIKVDFVEKSSLRGEDCYLFIFRYEDSINKIVSSSKKLHIWSYMEIKSSVLEFKCSDCI